MLLLPYISPSPPLSHFQGFHVCIYFEILSLYSWWLKQCRSGRWLPAMQETWVQSLGQDDPLMKVPMQETLIRSLVQEDPACLRAIKPLLLY